MQVAKCPERRIKRDTGYASKKKKKEGLKKSKQIPRRKEGGGMMNVALPHQARPKRGTLQKKKKKPQAWAQEPS